MLDDSDDRTGEYVAHGDVMPGSVLFFRSGGGSFTNDDVKLCLFISNVEYAGLNWPIQDPRRAVTYLQINTVTGAMVLQTWHPEAHVKARGIQTTLAPRANSYVCNEVRYSTVHRMGAEPQEFELFIPCMKPKKQNGTR